MESNAISIWGYPTTMGFPTQNDHVGCFGGTAISGNTHICTMHISYKIYIHRHSSQQKKPLHLFLLGNGKAQIHFVPNMELPCHAVPQEKIRRKHCLCRFRWGFWPTSSFVVSQVNGSNNNQVRGTLDVFVSPHLKFVTDLVMEGKAMAWRFFQVETASLYLRVKVDGVRQCQMRSSKNPLVGPYRGSIAQYGIPYEVCPGFHGIGFVSVWCSVAQRWWLNKQCSSQPESPCPFQKKPALSSVFPKKSA